MITARLWYVNRSVAGRSSQTSVTKKLRTVQRIVVESASLYSGTMLLYLITYQLETNYSIIFGDMVRLILLATTYHVNHNGNDYDRYLQ